MKATVERPVRHFEMPATLGGKLHAWRFLIARRVVQLGVLLLFFGTVAWGWKLAGAPLLAGNLSAATLASERDQHQGSICWSIVLTFASCSQARF